MFRCPAISTDDKINPSLVMCRVNKRMEYYDSRQYSTKCKSTIESMVQPTYMKTTATSQEECPLQCTMLANEKGRAGCCEYRASDSTCVWTAALNNPYLASEQRDFDPSWWPNNSLSFKDTKSVLCSSGITWEGILLIEFNHDTEHALGIFQFGYNCRCPVLFGCQGVVMLFMC